MNRRARRVVAAVAGIACLATVSILPAGADATSQLQGEGESWPLPMLERLQNNSAPKIAPFAAGYIDVGDDQARSDVADGVADYASLGAPFSAAQLAAAKQHGRSIAYVPYAYGGVAVAFSVDTQSGGRVPGMKLTAPTLAKIFTHQIAIWADPEILAENVPDPGNLANAKLPGILSVTRLDSSWSTASLIQYFLSDAAARPIWNAYATAPALASPPDTPLDRWPADPFSSTVGIISGSKGVIDTMLQLDPATGLKKPAAATHHIAYLAPAWTTKYSAPVVSVQNKAGQFVTPTSAGVLKAIEQGATVDPKTNLITLDFNKMTDPAAYPIPMVEYLAVPTTGLSAAKAKALSAFVKYILSDAGQKDVADTGYTPVSQETRTAGLKVAAALAATSTAQGGTTTTTTTVGSKTGSTTSTTSATTGTVGGAGDPGGGVSSGSGSGSGSGTALPFTGGPPPVVVVLAVFVGLVAVIGRRRARRARV